VAEYLAYRVKARTIFATHYHELNGLAAFFSQIENYQVLVEESGGKVEFLRRVVRGGASRSFGVQVAKMSGLPEEIVDRAMFIMGRLEKAGAAGKLLDRSRPSNLIMDEALQLSLFEKANEATASSDSDDQPAYAETSITVASEHIG
jgi:DNA mismatch repair protein MutS